MEHEPDGTRPTPKMAAAPTTAAPARHPLLRLQATAGNAAVLRLLAAQDGAGTIQRRVTVDKVAKRSEHVKRETPPGTPQEVRDFLAVEAERLPTSGTDIEAESWPDAIKIAAARIAKAGKAPAKSGSGPPPPKTKEKAKAKPKPIPALIHFIWLGKPPSPDAIANILGWAGQADGTSWRIKLWTDNALKAPGWEEALAPLGAAGKRITVHDTRKIVKPVLASYLAALGAEPAAYNMASDLARYCILLQEGGVYMDVDLGPGTVDLSSVPVLSVDDFPVVAAQLRDAQALDEELPTWKQEKISFDTAVRLAVGKAYAKNALNNNMLITHAGTEFMRSLIRRCVNTLKVMDDDRELWSGMAATLTGPTALIDEMVTRLGVDETVARHFAPEVFMNWKSLQWITAESQNQVEEAGSTPRKGTGGGPEGPSGAPGPSISSLSSTPSPSPPTSDSSTPSPSTHGSTPTPPGSTPSPPTTGGGPPSPDPVPAKRA
jgi:hypothetical protein